MKPAKLIPLSPANLDEIVSLEQRSFAPALQADGETILERFRLGHFMIGARDRGRLVGMIAFSYAHFSPHDFEGFPQTFRKFSTQSPCPNYNACFIYNLEVDSHRRGLGFARPLVCAALDRAKEDGCVFSVADGRASTYGETNPCSQERGKQNVGFRSAIDRYLDGGRFPTNDEFMLDPTLALYHRLTGCEFLWIIPEFVPEDRAAGGLRVILYGEMTTWRQPANKPASALSS